LKLEQLCDKAVEAAKTAYVVVFKNLDGTAKCNGPLSDYLKGQLNETIGQWDSIQTKMHKYVNNLLSKTKDLHAELASLDARMRSGHDVRRLRLRISKIK
jgi:hypothetical protein